MRLADGLVYAHSFAANALRGARPRILYVEVTKRCNAFCSFCPYWQTHRRDELADYSPIVEKMRPFCVTFTGGEPLLRRDMPELVRNVVEVSPHPYTALLTNGWLLSTERARALREAGLEQVSISIDYRGARHDEHRGLPGMYARFVERLPELKQVGFHRIVINTVIMESNLDEIVPLARETLRWGVIHTFSSYSTLKTASGDQLVDGGKLRALEKVIGELKRMKRREGHIGSSDYYLDRVVEYFRNGGKVGDRCRAAGQRFFHVDPWGHVKICPEFEPFAHWTELDEKKPDLEHGCTSCWYGCRGENEAPITLGRVRELRIQR